MDKVEVHADRLEGVIADTAAIQAVDLLTAEEIEFLREITSVSRSDLPQFVKAANSDTVKQGMLFQLSDLGFVEGFKVTSGEILGCSPTPKAAWAVARHDRRVADEAARERGRKRQRRWDRAFSAFMIVLGWLLGLLSSPLLSWADSMLRSSMQ